MTTKKLAKTSVKKTIKVPVKSIKKRVSEYLKRRSHRSFRRTRRRDYIKTLELPGYLKFTKSVGATLWANRKMFLLLALVYSVFTIILVGLSSQDAYSSISDTLSTTSAGNFTSFWGGIGKAGLLFASTVTGGLNGSLSESQQIFGGLILLMAWLTTVWLLRNKMAGNKVKLRDGLYNAGAPILPTFLVALILIFQLIPFALAIIGYSAASTTGLLSGGVEAMLFWFAAALLTLTSLYLIISTFFALVIVTLPGMYPFRAIKIAGDLVIGRRIRILLRLLWVLVLTAIIWALIMIPMILFDGWIKGILPVINWLPIVPMIILALGSLTAIWVPSYIYLLYRKVVDNDSAKA